MYVGTCVGGCLHGKIIANATSTFDPDTVENPPTKIKPNCKWFYDYSNRIYYACSTATKDK